MNLVKAEIIKTNFENEEKVNIKQSEELATKCLLEKAVKLGKLLQNHKTDNKSKDDIINKLSSEMSAMQREI